MSDGFDLQDILEDVLLEFGEWKKSPESQDTYLGLDKKKRHDFFKALVEEIKRHGKPKDYFTPKIKGEIVEAISAKKPKNQAGLKLFKEISLKSLSLLVKEAYGTNYDRASSRDEITTSQPEKIEPPKRVIKRLDPNEFADTEPPVEDVIDPEMAELLGLNNKDE